MTEQTAVTALHGVGPKRAEQLSRLGIRTVGELVRHFPHTYQNRGNTVLLCDATEGETVSLILTVSSRCVTARLRGKMTLTHFTAFDDSGSCRVTFFNQSYLESRYPVGSTHRFYGKLTKQNGRFSLSSPQSEAILADTALPDLVPWYPLCEGLRQKTLADLISQALQGLRHHTFGELLPASLRQAYDLPDVYTALCQMHAPTELACQKQAERRFLLEELYPFCMQIAIEKSKQNLGHAPRMTVNEQQKQTFLDALPYALTDGQHQVLRDIEEDLSPAKKGKTVPPMRRMICGDVGSGKTVCAAYAAYVALQNGYQCAIMAPTEVLAQQHFNTLSPMFARFGFRTSLLSGSMRQSEQKQIRAELAHGHIHLVIGTHSLISDSTEYANLGLVVTDEQHRFGVMQRAAFSEKTKGTVHTLVMSATPIPRSLSLILYGDLAMSALRELPPGRQHIDTAVIDESWRENLWRFVRRQVKEGHQVYVICPSVEDTLTEEELPDPALHAVLSHGEYLRTQVFADLRIGTLYGKQKPAEKEAVMAAFARGEIDILVSTTVVEVGVNVPNATLIVVENAERFGLSQLHQLRGRVGRGQAKSYCVLVSESRGETARERLSTLHRTNDGFEIAETDLRLRGPGDFFPSQSGEIRQSGDFRLASLCDDMTLLQDVHQAAQAVLHDDPLLQKEENQPLSHLLSSYRGVVS